MLCSCRIFLIAVNKHHQTQKPKNGHKKRRQTQGKILMSAAANCHVGVAFSFSHSRTAALSSEMVALRFRKRWTVSSNFLYDSMMPPKIQI
jgi:hypothetical protein